jgi:hypothetical protein
LDEFLRISPNTPIWESLFFDILSHIDDRHMDGQLQEYDIFEMLDPELGLALHFFFIHSVEILIMNMIAHSIFLFKTYFR